MYLKTMKPANDMARDNPTVQPEGEGLIEPLALLERRFRNLSPRISCDEVLPLIVARRQFDQDQPSWSDRGDLAHLFVLESGFAFKFEILPNGQRHIADFFGPGAICNWSRLNQFEQQDDIVFKARSTVTLLDAKKLAVLLDDRASLASAFRRHELARTMRTTQRIRSLIARGATEKMIIVLLDLFDEASTIGHTPEFLPLNFTQQEIADLLGVTPVHVSRTFSKLEEDGVVLRDRKSFKLIDPAGLRERLAYKSYFRTETQK